MKIEKSIVLLFPNATGQFVCICELNVWKILRIACQLTLVFGFCLKVYSITRRNEFIYAAVVDDAG